MTETAIEIKNLTKKYGNFLALNSTSVNIPANKVIGLIGPNGAGKSSLLNIIAGLSLGTSGTVKIFDRDISDVKIFNIGFMHESNPLPDTMRVGQYLRFRASLKGLKTNDIRLHVEKIMRLCDLYYEARHKMIKTLSKGFRQRVGIADALINEPQLIILDEPTIGLDPHQIIGIRNLIDKAKQNSTMIISSHILSELENICNYFIIINHGTIIASGDIKTLRDQFFTQIDLVLKVISDIPTIEKFCNEAKLKDFIISETDCSSIYEIKLSVPLNSQHEKLLEKFSSYFKSKFLGFIDNKPSLEDIFITATKRFIDQV